MIDPGRFASPQRNSN